MSDRRRYPRVGVGMTTLFKGGNQALGRARLRDISRSGLFLETSEPIERDEFVIINLDALAPGKELSMRCKVVRRIPSEGMGLEITLSTDEKFLRDWLDQQI